jgi:hypothetical protein
LPDLGRSLERRSISVPLDAVQNSQLLFDTARIVVGAEKPQAPIAVSIDEIVHRAAQPLLVDHHL